MKIIYDDKVVFLGDDAVESLRAFAVAFMDAMRKAEPDLAHCWNVARCTICDSGQPSFCYGANWEGLFAEPGIGFDIVHPSEVKAPPKKPSNPTKKKRSRK